MKKRVLPLYSIITGTIGLLQLAFLWILQSLPTRGMELYFTPKSFTAADFLWNSVLWISFLLVSAVTVFVCRGGLTKKWLKVVIIIVLVIGMLGFLLWGFVKSMFMPHEYVELASPDGKHCIIIAEDTYPFSVYGGDIYEKNSFCTMKNITKYEADIDFYKPFSNGKYEIVWGEESCEISYDFDGKGTYKTITVEYLK